MDYHGMARLLNINTMDPGEALSTAAQIAVALAGFAGVTLVFRRESVQQLQGALATGFAFYLFGLVGTGAVLFQIFNIAILNTFWPFFTGIVVHLLAVMFQFARIIPLSSEA
jgi:hypothetical protein